MSIDMVKMRMKLDARDDEIKRLRTALERIRTLDEGKLWTVEASDAIAALVEIATVVEGK